MSARDRILARLKTAAPAQALELPHLPAPSAHRLTDDALPEALQKFIGALEGAHAEIIDARTSGTTNTHWAASVQKICKLKNIQRLLVPASLKGLSGIDGVTVEAFDQPVEAIKDALFNEIDAGLTVADCALADTGVLVMRSCRQQPRTLSLVPPIHFCLINVNRLYADMRGAMAGEAWVNNMPSNLIFISGPSKTADIQQTLAYGAHGPKELIVILVEEDVL